MSNQQSRQSDDLPESGKRQFPPLPIVTIQERNKVTISQEPPTVAYPSELIEREPEIVQENQANSVQLVHVLARLFSLDELRELCFDVNLEYEELGEGGRTSKSIELVKYFERRNQLDDLARAVIGARSNLVTWELLGRSDLAEIDQTEGKPPYKGLAYFDMSDVDLFFGREVLTAELIKQLRHHRFLAVVGASGSGKSSIVRAGLVPALKKNQPIVKDIRYPEGSQNWPVHIITPTNRPLLSLATSLSKSVEEADKMQMQYAKSQRWLDYHVRFILRKAGAQHLLLVVDQFEELFTQCKDEAERLAFIDNLIYAAHPEGNSPLTIVITLRADFYAHCGNYEGLRQMLARQQVYLGPMSQGELRQAIEKPANRYGWRFEQGLVDLLLEDVGEEPGALPLLSHALLETWKQREGVTMTLSGYIRSGGIRGAIAKTADFVFTETLATDEEQAIVKSIFLRLTEIGEGTQETRRRAQRSELVRRAGDTVVERVIQQLADARLIIVDGERVEVSHEALIREWPTLRKWLEENREGLKIHRDLADAARDWGILHREPDALYRGTRLAQAVDWAHSHPEELSELEQDFLVASQEAVKAVERAREAAQKRELEQARQVAAEAEARRLAEAKHAKEAEGRAQDQEQAYRRLRRRNVWIMAAVALTAVVAIVAMVFWRRSEATASDLRITQGELEAERDIAVSRQLAAQSQLNLNGPLDVALLLGVEATSRAETVESRSSLLRALLRNPRQVTFLPGHASYVTSVAVSPDGRLLASAGCGQAERYYLCTMGEIRLWDLATAQQIGQPLQGHEALVKSIAFSADGAMVASQGDDHRIVLWNVADGEAVGELPAESAGPVTFSPDGRWLASGSGDTITLWDLSEIQPVRRFTDDIYDIQSLVFSADGSLLASGGFGNIVFWDVSSGRPIHRIFTGSGEFSGNPVVSVAFSPDGKTLASGGCGFLAARGCAGGEIRLWDVALGQEIGQPMYAHADMAYGIAYSADGQTLASGSCSDSVLPAGCLLGEIRFWNVHESGLTESYQYTPLVAHTGVSSLTFSRDGRLLVAGSQDGNISLWDMSAPDWLSQPMTRRFEGHVDDSWFGTPGVAFSPDGQTLASGGTDGKIILWDIESGRPLFEPLMDHAGAVYSVSFNADGSLLASGSEDGTVILWDPASGRRLAQFTTSHGHVIWSVAFSPDAETLAAGSCSVSSAEGGCSSGIVHLWNVRTLQPASEPYLGHNGMVRSVTYSPDGSTIASGSEDGTVILWNVSTGRPIYGPIVVEDYANSVAFSPDGTLLAVGSDSTLITLWHVATGEKAGQPFKGHISGVASVAFSPDGKTLASGACFRLSLCAIGETYLWDVATRRMIGQSLDTWNVTKVVFSPDGSTLAAGREDGSIVLWEVSSSSWQERACRSANRNLTQEEWDLLIGENEPYHQTCQREIRTSE